MSTPGPAAVIVLAAGEGARMKSSLPKTLHRVCGRTMLGHALTAATELAPQRLIVVVGHGGEEVAAKVREQAPGAIIVVQDYLGGTGHAVRVALESVGTIPGTVVVTYADAPLLRATTLAGLVAERARLGSAAVILTALAPDPTGYGRIVRDAAGAFTAIVEQADASEEQRAINEINSGMYAFDGDLLADVVKRVRTDNAQGEEYLTDAVGVIRDDGYLVGTVQCPDFDEIQGVNDLAQLAQVSRVLNSRLLRQAMRAGVRIADPASTWVDIGVDLAPGAYIGPGTQLEGSTAVASGARVGPGCLLRDTVVGADATVISAFCENAVIGAGAHVGPYAHLLPGTQVAPGGRVGPTRAGDQQSARDEHAAEEQQSARDEHAAGRPEAEQT